MFITVAWCNAVFVSHPCRLQESSGKMMLMDALSAQLAEFMVSPLFGM